MKLNSNYFKKKTFIITGANQGLGLEIAKHFYQLGSNIAICARDKNKLLQVKKQLKPKPNQIIIIEKCDVSKSNEIDIFFMYILQKYNQIECLLHLHALFGFNLYIP